MFQNYWLAYSISKFSVIPFYFLERKHKVGGIKTYIYISANGSASDVCLLFVIPSRNSFTYILTPKDLINTQRREATNIKSLAKY